MGISAPSKGTNPCSALFSSRLIFILQVSPGCKMGANHIVTSVVSLSLKESSTGWWVGMLRKIVRSILCGNLSGFWCGCVWDVGGGFFCLPLAQVVLARGPGMTLSFLCPHPLTYSETQGWRRSCREGLCAGVWAVLVRSGENQQEGSHFFVCVSRNSCVSLHLLVLWLCSAVVLGTWDQWNEIGTGLMILLCRRNIEFDPYVFFLYATPLIYAIAFYCLQNEVFKLEAFRWFMIFQKKPNKNWNKFSQILWAYWSLFFLRTIRYWRWCYMGKSSKKNMLQAGLSPLLKPECPSMITEVNCDALPGISFGLMLGVHCHHLMWKFIHLLLETWVWG